MAVHTDLNIFLKNAVFVLANQMAKKAGNNYCIASLVKVWGRDMKKAGPV